MKNIILIVGASLLVIALCMSLGGNAYQFYQSDQTRDQMQTLQKDLSNSQSKLSTALTDLTAAKSDLNKANSKISTLTDRAEQAEDKYKDLSQLQSSTQDKLDDAQADLYAVYCTTTIPIVDAKYASTNTSLLDPITEVVEKYSDKSSIGTTYKVIWNNSKDATFTVKMRDNTTSQVVVSWSWNSPSHVRAIYNINGGCYFYFDRAY